MSSFDYNVMHLPPGSKNCNIKHHQCFTAIEKAERLWPLMNPATVNQTCICVHVCVCEWLAEAGLPGVSCKWNAISVHLRYVKLSSNIFNTQKRSLLLLLESCWKSDKSPVNLGWESVNKTVYDWVFCMFACSDQVMKERQHATAELL